MAKKPDFINPTELLEHDATPAFTLGDNDYAYFTHTMTREAVVSFDVWATTDGNGGDFTGVVAIYVNIPYQEDDPDAVEVLRDDKPDTGLGRIVVWAKAGTTLDIGLYGDRDARIRVRCSDYVDPTYVQRDDVTASIGPGGDIPDYGGGTTEVGRIDFDGQIATDLSYDIKSGFRFNTYTPQPGIFDGVISPVGNTYGGASFRNGRVTFPPGGGPGSYDPITSQMVDCAWAHTRVGSPRLGYTIFSYYDEPDDSCPPLLTNSALSGGLPAVGVAQHQFRQAGFDVIYNMGHQAAGIVLSVDGIERYYSSILAPAPTAPEGELVIPLGQRGELQDLDLAIDEAATGLADDDADRLRVDWRIGKTPIRPRFADRDNHDPDTGFPIPDVPLHGFTYYDSFRQEAWGGDAQGWSRVVDQTRRITINSGGPTQWFPVSSQEIAEYRAHEATMGPQTQGSILITGIPMDVYSSARPTWFEDPLPQSPPGQPLPTTSTRQVALRWQGPAMRATVRPPMYAHAPTPEIWDLSLNLAIDASLGGITRAFVG